MTFGFRAINQDGVVQIDENYRNLGFSTTHNSDLYFQRVAGQDFGCCIPGHGDYTPGAFGIRVWDAAGNLSYDSRQKRAYITQVHVIPQFIHTASYNIALPDGSDQWWVHVPSYYTSYDVQSLSGTEEGPFELIIARPTWTWTPGTLTVTGALMEHSSERYPATTPNIAEFEANGGYATDLGRNFTILVARVA